MYLQKFTKNEYIFKEKDQASALYILKEVNIFFLSIYCLEGFSFNKKRKTRGEEVKNW